MDRMETVSPEQLSDKTDLEEYDLVVLGSGTGSKIAACQLELVGRFPEPETINTLPLCNRATWTGLIGICGESVCHRPCLFSCA